MREQDEEGSEKEIGIELNFMGMGLGWYSKVEGKGNSIPFPRPQLKVCGLQ
jgi:hypothetical protein